MRLRRIRRQGGQTGRERLVLLVALEALGVSVYTYLQVAEWRDRGCNARRDGGWLAGCVRIAHGHHPSGELCQCMEIDAVQEIVCL